MSSPRYRMEKSEYKGLCGLFIDIRRNLPILASKMDSKSRYRCTPTMVLNRGYRWEINQQDGLQARLPTALIAFEKLAISLAEVRSIAFPVFKSAIQTKHLCKRLLE